MTRYSLPQLKHLTETFKTGIVVIVDSFPHCKLISPKSDLIIYIASTIYSSCWKDISVHRWKEKNKSGFNLATSTSTWTGLGKFPWTQNQGFQESHCHPTPPSLTYSSFMNLALKYPSGLGTFSSTMQSPIAKLQENGMIMIMIMIDNNKITTVPKFKSWFWVCYFNLWQKIQTMTN